MAPVATSTATERAPTESALKQEPVGKETVFNPFYSPSIGDDGDDTYQYAKYKVASRVVRGSRFSHASQPTFPNLKWDALKEIDVSDRGLHADPEKKSLFAAASKVKTLTPAIGTEILGVDLRQLTNAQKDEL
jgi:sulfonate dioxygenase